MAVAAACSSPAHRIADAGPIDVGPDTNTLLPDAGDVDSSVTDAARSDGATVDDSLPIVHSVDSSLAALGRDVLYSLQGARLPSLALRSLWLVWNRFGLSESAYWQEFCVRYGFTPNPDGGLPLGVVEEGSSSSIQCLACHTNRVAGEVVFGVGNAHLRLDRLYADLVALNKLAPRYGISSIPIPGAFEDAFSDRNAGPGAIDAFGMAMTLAQTYAPGSGLEAHYGFQQAPAWWTMKYRNHIYSDGIAEVGAYRLMMATLLASGDSLTSLQSRDADFEAVGEFVLSTDAPYWPFDAPAPAAVDMGRAVFAEQCASCHGDAAGYPDRTVDVGTDPIRAERMGADEVAAINASWFAEGHPMHDTDGYLAPPLVGVWATAPYFHNGTVPDLRAVLVESERPLAWKASGTDVEDYDTERVGTRFAVSETNDPDAIVTTREGMSNAGHDFDLADNEVNALLAYLKTL